nr:MAG TPA: hypothetical protein [Bacteriophage sp.]
MNIGIPSSLMLLSSSNHCLLNNGISKSSTYLFCSFADDTFT